MNAPWIIRDRKRMNERINSTKKQKRDLSNSAEYWMERYFEDVLSPRSARKSKSKRRNKKDDYLF